MAAEPFFYNGGFAFEAATGTASPTPVAGVVCRFSAGVIHGVKDQLRAWRQSAARRRIAPASPSRGWIINCCGKSPPSPRARR